VLLPAVVAVAGAGILLPDPGRWADRHAGIDAVLVVLVLASALGVPAGAAASLRRLAVRLTVCVAVATVTLPLLAYGLSELLGPAPLRHGLLAVGVAPAEVASIGISGLAGGDVAVAAVALSVSTIVSVAVAGPVLALLAGTGVSSGHVLVQLALVVGLPLVVGLLARRWLPAGTDTGPAGDPAGDPGGGTGGDPGGGGAGGPVGPAGGPAGGGPVGGAAAVLAVISTVAVLVLVALVASQVHLQASYLAVTAVLVAMILVSAALGAGLGRILPGPAARSMLLHVSMRDFAIASGIASAAFGAAATGPLGIYGVLVIGWGALVANRSRPAPA
jgi:predicted Na+-dependent transporter